MAKVIMTSSEFVERLEAIVARKNFYSSKYAFNLCMICPPKSVKTFKCIDGVTRQNLNPNECYATSADCWNLIKSVLNGYDVNRQDVGYFQKDLSNTGDVDGIRLLNKCTDVSADFTKLRIGEPRYLYMKGSKVDHAGAYLGKEVCIDGSLYNVIESTASWGGHILYSWVDPDGTRRRSKGGGTNGRWTKHGLMTPWVKYDTVAPVQPEPAPVKEPVKNLDEKALQVYRGKYGNEPQRSQKLKAEGFTTAEIKTIQKKVNELYKANTTTPKEEPKIFHTVKAGDNLTMIARMYGTTILAILKLNPDIKDPNVIWINQKIRVK